MLSRAAPLLTIAALLAGPVRAAEPETAGPPPPQPAPSPMVQPEPIDRRDEMDAAVSLGGGLLEFFHLELGYMMSRRWTFGVDAGFFPIDPLLALAMGLDDISGATTVQGFSISGDVETRLGSGAVWARWFPWQKSLYVAGTVSLWRLDVTASGNLDHQDLDDPLDVKAMAKVWVPMLGLHLGWRVLWREGFFIDVGFGADLLLSPGAEVSLGGDSVRAASSDPMIASLFDDAEEFLSDVLQEGVERITSERKVLPSGYLRVGWAFDLW